LLFAAAATVLLAAELLHGDASAGHSNAPCCEPPR
jgi:hypothetical protein